MPAPPSTWRTKNLDGLSAEDFQRLFGVNTIGPFQMVRAARSCWKPAPMHPAARVAVGQRLVRCRHQRHRLVDRLCRQQGRAKHHHLFAGAGAGAADPVNTVCPGYIDTPWFTKGRGAEGAAKSAIP